MREKPGTEPLDQELIDLEKKVDALYPAETISPPASLDQQICNFARQHLELDNADEDATVSKDTSTDDLEQIIDDLYQAIQVTPPAQLDKTIKAKAWQSLQKTSDNADGTPVYTDQFLAMAAADSKATIVGERKSQSGEWTLRIYSDRDNADQGYVMLEVCSERAERFEGKQVTLTIGSQTLFCGPIRQGEAEAAISLVGLDIDKPLNIQID